MYSLLDVVGIVRIDLGVVSRRQHIDRMTPVKMRLMIRQSTPGRTTTLRQFAARLSCHLDLRPVAALVGLYSHSLLQDGAQRIVQ